MNSVQVRPIITLLSDFDTRDAYVGSMKGVVLSLNPQVLPVDLSHEVPPQDIRAGAFILAGVAPYFPAGTVHLAVVDPGVGSSRRGLAAFCREQFWVGPDNGLFNLIFRQAPALSIVSLENPRYFRGQVSATFHGRDIFAPVAAHLSLGVDLSRFGPPITDPVALELPEARFGPEAVQGTIIYVDQFGNLISNISEAELSAWLGDQEMGLKAGSLALRGLARTYSQVEPGEFLALIGSHGFLEIACSQAHAARHLNAGVGLPVKLHRE